MRSNIMMYAQLGEQIAMEADIEDKKDAVLSRVKNITKKLDVKSKDYAVKADARDKMVDALHDGLIKVKAKALQQKDKITSKEIKTPAALKELGVTGKSLKEISSKIKPVKKETNAAALPDKIMVDGDGIIGMIDAGIHACEEYKRVKKSKIATESLMNDYIDAIKHENALQYIVRIIFICISCVVGFSLTFFGGLAGYLVFILYSVIFGSLFMIAWSAWVRTNDEYVRHDKDGNQI